MPTPREIAVRIVQALRDAGFTAYFAGGCVRDELLGLHPRDYDIATDATPDDVRTLFSRTNEVGVSFGVMLVRLSGVTVEVTTFRREGAYSDRRRPDEVWFADAESDARRRDFTINALFLDPLAPPGEAESALGATGAVIDFVGGLDDLRRHFIRAVGAPEDRLGEDHLRALRAVRFAARLGFAIDPATADAIAKHARELEGVSRERIGDEIRRMMLEPTRAVAARLLETLGLDAPVLMESAIGCAAADGMRLLATMPSRCSYAAALAAWAMDRRNTTGSRDPGDELAPEPPSGGNRADAASAEAMLRSEHVGSRLRKALCLSNEERDELNATLSTLGRITWKWNRLTIAERKRLAAASGFETAMIFLNTLEPALHDIVAADLSKLQMDGVGISPAPFLTGDELIRLGARPGPALGALLRDLYDRQLDSRLPSREAAVDFARQAIEPVNAADSAGDPPEE